MPNACPVRRRRLVRFITITLGVILIATGIICGATVIKSSIYNSTPSHQRLDPGRLKAVFAIFRHGDRTPGHSFPTDDYKNGDQYVEGWGQLTKAGKQRMLQVGRLLRKRYNDFLPLAYSPDDIYMLSSDADRCLMSAECLLTGLYPPQGEQIIENDLGWQPIPVHTIPRDYDKLVAAKRACPTYDVELKHIYASPEVQQFNKDHASLYAKVSSHTNVFITSVDEAEGLYNTLYLQESMNLTLPQWATKEVMQELKEIATYSLQLFTQTQSMQRIRGGPLLGEILNRMRRTEDGKKTHNLFLVSGHDLTLINLLRNLHFTEEKWKPEFSAAFILELHKSHKTSDYIVKVLYSNSFGKEPLIVLSIPGCENPCSLTTLTHITKDRIPDDWEEECKL